MSIETLYVLRAKADETSLEPYIASPDEPILDRNSIQQMATQRTFLDFENGGHGRDISPKTVESQSTTCWLYLVMLQA